MPVKSKWFSLSANDDVAEISVFDEIGGFGVSVSEFKDQFDLIKNRKEIRLLLNSPGGSVTEGMAFYNLIASVRGKVVVEIIGFAASIASIVALAGRELIMDEGTYLMIHNPWTITWGGADQLRKDADVLDKMRNELINIYGAHSKLGASKIGELMDNETWLTADEAFSYGFASGVEKTQAVAMVPGNLASVGFKNVPRALLGKTNYKAVKTIRDFEEFLRDAGASRSEAEAIASCGWKQGDPAKTQNARLGETVAALKTIAAIFQ